MLKFIYQNLSTIGFLLLFITPIIVLFLGLSLYGWYFKKKITLTQKAFYIFISYLPFVTVFLLTITITQQVLTNLYYDFIFFRVIGDLYQSYLNFIHNYLEPIIQNYFFPGFVDPPFIAVAIMVGIWGLLFTAPGLIPLSIIFIFLVKKNKLKLQIFDSNVVNFIYLIASVFMIFFTVACLFVIGWFFENTCRTKIFKIHDFNAHLKSICGERADKGECPRDENQLKAFKPDVYEEIQTCAPTFYDWNEERQEYTFLVKDGEDIFVINPHYLPLGYKWMHLEKTNAPGHEVYPPDFEGPWEKFP